MYPGALSKHVCTIAPLEYIFISQCAPAVPLYAQCYMQWPSLRDSAYISSETEQVTLPRLLVFTTVHAHQGSNWGDAFKLRSMRAAGLTSPGRNYITTPTKGRAHAGEDKQAESHQLSAAVSWKAVKSVKFCLFASCLLHSDHT